MPDIAQLPKLASYYDITVDELIGYEAQLSMEDVKKYYTGFAEDFAKKPFDEVMTEVRDFVRRYYSCHEVLFQMVVLLLNHYTLAEPSKQPEIFEEMIRLCERIQEKCLDVSTCADALVLQAMVELFRGNPESVIEKLKSYQNPRNIKEGAEGLLIQAYHMTGRTDEALEWNQVVMFNNLLSLIVNGTSYLMSNLSNKDTGLETIERLDKVAAAYEVEKLHPNTFLQFQYAKAVFYAINGMNNEALDMLESFVEGVADFVENGLYLHGDAYFDRMDNYFNRIDSYMTTPRSKEIVLASILQNLENPMLAGLSDTEKFKKIKRRAEEWKN